MLSTFAFASTREAWADNTVDFGRYFHDSVEISVPGMKATSPIHKDVPLLVRLSSNTPAGFDPSLAGDAGRYLRFAYVDSTQSTTVTNAAPCEIDTWDPSGESLVWVKHPELNLSTNRKLVMFWNPIDAGDLPALDPAETWNAYAAVAHLADGRDSVQIHEIGAFGQAGMARHDGVIGGCGTNPLVQYSAGIEDDLLESGFTASMWIKLNDAAAAVGSYPFMLGRSVSGGVTTALVAAKFTGSADALSVTIYPGTENNTDGFTYSLKNKLEVDQWTRFDFIFSPVKADDENRNEDFVDLFVNGKPVLSENSRKTYSGTLGSSPVTITESGASQCQYDEIRISTKIPNKTSDARIAIELSQVDDSEYIAFGTVMRDGLIVNHWVREPSLSKTLWKASEAPATFDRGEAFMYDIDVSFENIITGAKSATMPTSGGSYRAYFTVAEQEDYAELVKTIDFVIENVTIAGGSAGPDAYLHNVKFIVKTGSFTETTENYPFLVHLANNTPNGFTYDSLPYGSDTAEEIYNDVRFFDEHGNSLNYEIDTWDNTSDSYIWVLIPKMADGSEITMCWGRAADSKLVKNDPNRVWNSYIGVWHMNEEVPLGEGGNVVAKDSTGHGLDAAPDGAENGDKSANLNSRAGRFGNARQIMNSDATGSNGCWLTIPNYDSFAAGSNFTISFWIKFDDYASWPGVVVRRDSNTGNNGFYVELSTNRRQIVVRGAGGTSVASEVFSKDAKNIDGFTYITLVYEGDKCSIYSNGALAASGTVGAVTDNGHVLWLGRAMTSEHVVVGAFDEVRLSKGAMSADRVVAEYRQTVNAELTDIGRIGVNGSVILANSWLREPSLTDGAGKNRTEWAPGATPAVVDVGRTRGKGEIKVSYIDRSTGETIVNPATGEPVRTLPTEAGEYRAVFTYEQTGNWSALEYTIDFHIIAREGHHNIGDVSARVLLANDDDTIADARVDFQGYDYIDNWPGVPFWKHFDAEDELADYVDNYTELNQFYNLFAGTRHELNNGDGNRLWYLEGVRFGNLFPNGYYYPGRGMTGTSSVQNYLPWNPASKRMVGVEGYPVGDYREYVGNFVIQNVQNAAIYSPLYEDGIGTIYFDAVNGWTDNAGDGRYQIDVEVCTTLNEDSGLAGEIPTDEVIGNNERDAEAADFYANAEWRSVAKFVVEFGGSSPVTHEVAAGESFDLAIKNGGDTRNFYRFYIPLNINQPSRFRIVRRSVDANNVYNPDGPAMILMDNLLVSTPVQNYAIVPCGKEFAKDMRAYLGREATFNPPYPSVNDEIFALAKVVDSNGKQVEPSVVSVAAVHYRWNYLNQLSTDWRIADLKPTADGVLSSSERLLGMPGLEGDLEYWFEGARSAIGSFYEYVDYTGLNLGVPDYYEADLNIPTDGHQYVTRIREGRSDYSEAVVITRPVGSETAVTNSLFVIGDGTWRGFVSADKLLEDGLEYRIELRNRQTPGTAEFLFNTNRLSATESVMETPATVAMEEGGVDDWAVVPCKGNTGYLMFKITENPATVSISRADWQDFNLWSSAVNVNGLFVGDSVDENSSSRTSKEYLLDVSAWPASVATNPFWTEEFSVSSGVSAAARYPRNVPFSSGRSENGWTAENAMWTYGKWSNASNNSMGDDSAVQLEGRGKGRLAFIGNVSAPKGLDAITYTARVAQFNEFENFSYYNGYKLLTNAAGQFQSIEWATSMHDYTVVSMAALTELGKESYSGDGSISLVGYYHPQFGCYEMRISRNTTENSLKMTLYRWRNNGSTMICDELGSGSWSYAGSVQATRLVKDRQGALGGIFFSIQSHNANNREGTLISAGICRTDSNPVSPSNQLKGKEFTCMSYFDTNANRHTGGTWGVLAKDCPGVFVKPARYNSGVGKLGTINLANDTVQYPGNVSMNFLGEFIPGPTAESEFEAWYNEWVIKPGRIERLTDHAQCFGFQAVKDVSQQVVVQISRHGESLWENVVTNTVSGFADTEFVNTVHRAYECDVRLQVLGEPLDRRTDVVINRVSLSQWAGEWTKGWDDSSAYGLTNDFVYTEGWISEGANGRVLQLQPARTTALNSPVSLRSPVLHGFGLFQFEWEDADENCVLLLQVCKGANRNNLITRTKLGPNDSNWETVETYEFKNLERNGHATYYLNLRYPESGAIRLVVDSQVVAKSQNFAESKGDPDYGSIRIKSAYVWDLPAYDSSSWSGWNFRASGWDGVESDTWAYLKDGKRGLSAILNNTLEENTLADSRKEYYRNRLPGVQSPTFEDTFIGQIDFKARLYDQSDISAGHGAVVTIYGSSEVNEQGEPIAWREIADVEVTDAVYGNYTVRLGSNANLLAVRFAVKGVAGVTAAGEPVYDPPLRVAIDDICISEQLAPTLMFKNLRVRPFRNSEFMRASTAVPDIDSAEEQPIAGESFGFQAELELLADDGTILLNDPRHPISVDLWYYVGEEPWGFENWKDAPGTVRVKLRKATDADMVFRSALEDSLSLCPPQILGEGERSRIVQYHVTANGYDHDLNPLDPHELTAKEWTMPEWYNGFTDPNKVEGAAFSAFTILDPVAPHRAWINEVNFCEEDTASSKIDQWIELAIPADVNMDGWEVRLYGYNAGFAGTLFTLGREGPAMKPLAEGDKNSRYCFYTAKSPFTTTINADAIWREVSGYDLYDGWLDEEYPWGFELVRPNGIIEHRVVVQGWNQLSTTKRSWATREGTNLVEILNVDYPKNWVWGEEDKHTDPGCTAGVIANTGAVHAEWYSPMRATPNAMNEKQVIDPDWLTQPNGDYVWMYFSLSGLNIAQDLGGETGSTLGITVGLGASTNITYTVDRWYELGELQVEGDTKYTVVSNVNLSGESTYVVNFTQVSNRTDVTASAVIRKDLRDLGVDSDNDYTPAIMKWLADGVTGGADGGNHPMEGDSIKPLVYRGTDGSVSEALSIDDAYWLDVDPTDGNWELWGGVGDRPGNTGTFGPTIDNMLRDVGGNAPIHTNKLVTVWLQLTNTVTGVSYPPYRMQGLGNEKSDEFGGVWTSANFKVTMALKNGLVDNNFQPMRYFVFDKDSFYPADDPDTPFCARVEITDPFSDQSPAAEWGWQLFSKDFLGASWDLDRRITPSGVETLKKEDYLEY